MTKPPFLLMYKAQAESGSSQKQESRTYLGTGRTRVGREAQELQASMLLIVPCRPLSSSIFFFTFPRAEPKPNRACNETTNKQKSLIRSNNA
jgi:hypothetical protein